eukprot:m.515998 g.515998  ORF g.515998 m.515998 type:complete len:741 (-) comp21926_c0_seq5:417-2639(-)
MKTFNMSTATFIVIACIKLVLLPKGVSGTYQCDLIFNEKNTLTVSSSDNCSQIVTSMLSRVPGLTCGIIDSGHSYLCTSNCGALRPVSDALADYRLTCLGGTSSAQCPDGTKKIRVRPNCNDNFSAAISAFLTSPSRAPTPAPTLTPTPLASWGLDGPPLTCGETRTGTTAGSASHVPSPGDGNAPDHHFLFTAVIDGTYIFSTCASTFNTVGHVYTYVDGGLGSRVSSCDDCGPCSNRAVLRPTLTVATVYVIVIDGYSRRRGNYSIEVTCPPTPRPTTAPTPEPTTAPTVEPTRAPTVEPTVAPTTEPSGAPTPLPTTVAPSLIPTSAPTTSPTGAPTEAPSLSTPARPSSTPRASARHPTTETATVASTTNSFHAHTSLGPTVATTTSISISHPTTLPSTPASTATEQTSIHTATLQSTHGTPATEQTSPLVATWGSMPTSVNAVSTTRSAQTTPATTSKSQDGRVAGTTTSSDAKISPMLVVAVAVALLLCIGALLGFVCLRKRTADRQRRASGKDSLSMTVNPVFTRAPGTTGRFDAVGARESPLQNISTVSGKNPWGERTGVENPRYGDKPVVYTMPVSVDTDEALDSAAYAMPLAGDLAHGNGVYAAPESMADSVYLAPHVGIEDSGDSAYGGMVSYPVPQSPPGGVSYHELPDSESSDGMYEAAAPMLLQQGRTATPIAPTAATASAASTRAGQPMFHPAEYTVPAAVHAETGFYNCPEEIFNRFNEAGSAI